MAHGDQSTTTPAVTYTSSLPSLQGHKVFTCKRCGRKYPYPEVGARPIRCECGWWYENDGFKIVEAFKPRLSTPNSTTPPPN